MAAILNRVLTTALTLSAFLLISGTAILTVLLGSSGVLNGLNGRLAPALAQLAGATVLGAVAYRLGHHRHDLADS